MLLGFIARSTLPVHNYELFVIIKKIRFCRKEWQKSIISHEENF
jgi:hypothetical protein